MRRVGGALVSLIGLWVLGTSPSQLAYGALYLAGVLAGGYDGSRSSQLVAVAVASIPFLAAVALGVALLVWRVPISSRLFPEGSTMDTSGETDRILGFAVVLLGLYFVVVAVSGAFRSTGTSVAQIVSLARSGGGDQAFVLNQAFILGAALLSYAIQLAVGLWLMFRPSRVVHWATSRLTLDA